MADINNSVQVTIPNIYSNTMLFLTISVDFDRSNYKISGSTTAFIKGSVFQSGSGNLEFKELPLVRGGQLLSGTSLEIRSDITKFLVTATTIDPPILSYTVTFEAGDHLICEKPSKMHLNLLLTIS